MPGAMPKGDASRFGWNATHRLGPEAGLPAVAANDLSERTTAEESKSALSKIE